MILRDGSVTRPTVNVRKAVAGDLAYIDMLQARFSHEVGYLPTVALEKRIQTGSTWIAFQNGQPAAYVSGVTPYMRRSDLAIIYQAAVEYDAQRRLISTALVEAWCGAVCPNANQICLWCAQDINANLFWSSLGFHAIAWRVGSLVKGRIHLFWSRCLPGIADDVALWVPLGTEGGLLRKKSIVHLMEPGQSWDERPSIQWAQLSADAAAAKLLKPEQSVKTVKAHIRAAMRADKQIKTQVEKQATFSQPPPGMLFMMVGGKRVAVPKLGG